MINEAYCSYEVSKLLKEKGFIGDGNIGCRNGFYVQNKSYPSEIGLCYDDLDNKELDWNECLRFTHQMAMAWLREEHRIHISLYAILDPPEEGCIPEKITYTYNILNANEPFHFFDDYDEVIIDTPQFNYYEQAIEAALKYTLENLI